MGARLRVFLTRARKIEPCSTSQQQMYPRKSKTPAGIIRLNAQGWYVEKIAANVNWTAQAVTEVLHKWEKLGIERLRERPLRRGKAKWKEENLVFLEEDLRTEPHTYNSHQLTEKLEQERSIKLSLDRLRRVLKKRGSIGSGLGRSSKTRPDSPQPETSRFRDAGIITARSHKLT